MPAQQASPPYSRLAGVYDEIVVDPCYSRWAAFVDQLWSSAPDFPVRSVLDVCCGTGLMTYELSALGYDLVGMDASAEMLARAATLLGPGVPLVRETLPLLGVDRVFDAAVSTFDGLNYLSPDDLDASLAAIAGALRPGGWLIFDLHTDALMEFTLANPVVSGEDQGHAFTITNTVDVAARTCDTKVEMTRLSDADAFSEHHRQYFHSDATVRDGLLRSGFEVITVSDEYTSTPADDATLRATWVARKR